MESLNNRQIFDQQSLQDIESSTEKRLVVSETLIVGVDIGSGNDISVLQVMRYSKGVGTVINTLYGADAIYAYQHLTDKGHRKMPELSDLSKNAIRYMFGFEDIIPEKGEEK